MKVAPNFRTVLVAFLAVVVGLALIGNGQQPEPKNRKMRRSRSRGKR